jgi:protoporphyrinogen IX oxidase
VTFLTLKALHIVAVVAWFAGLFYIVRLFVYLVETHDRPQEEQDILLPQLQLMARRLWFGITWPAGIATVGFGTALMASMGPPQTWLLIKLALVAGLIGYHLICHVIHARLQRGQVPMSSRSLRIWNEVATLFLVAIVFLVVLKNSLAMIWGVVGLGVFSAVLLAGIAVYGRMRKS